MRGKSEEYNGIIFFAAEILLHTRLHYKSVRNENLEKLGSSPGESQIALGAWENTLKDQGGSNTKKQ